MLPGRQKQPEAVREHQAATERLERAEQSLAEASSKLAEVSKASVNAASANCYTAFFWPGSLRRVLGQQKNEKNRE